MKLKLLAICALSFTCTKRVNDCDSNADCTNPAYPFCDVNGTYEPSGGMKNVCTIIPPDCPVDVCGCQPGATTCGSDQIVTCNADGMSTTTTSCGLGCGSDGLSCATFTPSNGLGPILAEAGSAGDFVVPAGATIDTSACEIEMANTALLHGSLVASPQASGKICAFAANNFTIGNVSAAGTYPVAFVAANDITISGILDAGAKASTPGPGAQPIGSPCDGGGVVMFRCFDGAPPQPGRCSEGGGGGGNATAGGSGGSDGYLSTEASGSGSGYAGAMAAAAFSPLVGGCSGGSGSDTLTNNTGSDVLGFISEQGGAGGGAVQLVAGSSIELVGIVNVGGGGGLGSASALGYDGMTIYSDPQGTGGGAGGTLVIETPVLTISPGGGFAANGGGGGGCGMAGADGAADSAPASGGTSGSATCVGVGYSFPGGTGGTATLFPTLDDFDQRAAPTPDSDAFGGGGGSVGRVRIATRSGTVPTSPSVQSAVITAEALVTN
ncbi:MAG TPA: hypothetical protein VGG74_03765 [Kofleriaceae bacterium]|jgi:hypothetical protein